MFHATHNHSLNHDTIVNILIQYLEKLDIVPQDIYEVLDLTKQGNNHGLYQMIQAYAASVLQTQEKDLEETEVSNVKKRLANQLKKNPKSKKKIDKEIILTKHAQSRMQERNISKDHISRIIDSIRTTNSKNIFHILTIESK